MAFEKFYSGASDGVRDAMIIGRNDKRNFIRMNIDARVVFTRPNSPQQHSAKTKDLSATGLCFITDTPVEIGEQLEVAVHPGTDLTPPLLATMTVIRVQRDADSKYDVAGVIKEKRI